MIAIIGTGPAGLMAADILASHGNQVKIFEKRKAPAWKLFIAGSSGLNITNNLPIEEFSRHYSGNSTEKFWANCLQNFSPQDWINFIESKLELGTFLGTSGRYFVETMHAAKLVRNWRRRLEKMDVQFHLGYDCTGFKGIEDSNLIRLDFHDRASEEFNKVIFCLGGGSWEQQESPLKWPEIFTARGISFQPFTSSNTGYEVEWPEKFLVEAEGKPLKNINLKTNRGEKRGDLVITSFGLEGTPVYFYGEVGKAYLDLKPDLAETTVLQKLENCKENLAPLRRAHKLLNLCDGSKALLFHMADTNSTKDLPSLAHLIKNFPLRLKAKRPLSESISSQGGIIWQELDENLMLKKYPGVYCAGEMIDWDAPTGGFLIQACVSMGSWVAEMGKNAL